MKKNIYRLILLPALLCAGSCSFFSPKMNNVLDESDSYSARSMVYASFVGLYSLLQDVVPEVIVVSELRGDLIMPTDNAPDAYWEVYNYDRHGYNEIADPTPLYNIVVNCNDFLRNAIKYNDKYPGVIPVPTYRQMIAGTVALRSWAYLNIGKLYGKASYYDFSMSDILQGENLRVLQFDELVPELIYFMNEGVDGISGQRIVNINDLFGTSGIWSSVPVNPDALMLELYLWNRDYELAAKKGVNMITGQSLTAAGDVNNLTCSFLYGSDESGTNPWRNLFSKTPVAGNGKEAATIVLYDNTYRQPNPLHTLFSNDPNCDYRLKCTSALKDRFTGKDYQTSLNPIADPRGEGVSYLEDGSELLFNKYTLDRTIQTQDASVYVYRAGEIFLMIAEALSALGNYDAADAIMNEGFQPYWVAGKKYNAPFDAPIYGFEKLKQSRGVRGRVEVPKIPSTLPRFIGDLSPEDPRYDIKRRAALDSLIIEETARELAGEGKRWFTMMRIARNAGRPELLARLVSGKFRSDRRKDVYDMMLDNNNWFINENE